MTIEYTAHAVERMLQRQLTPKEIKSILEEPDGSIQQSTEKSIVYKHFPRRKDNLIAAVVARKDQDKVLIVTVLINFEVQT